MKEKIWFRGICADFACRRRTKRKMTGKRFLFQFRQKFDFPTEVTMVLEDWQPECHIADKGPRWIKGLTNLLQNGGHYIVVLVQMAAIDAVSLFQRASHLLIGT